MDPISVTDMDMWSMGLFMTRASSGWEELISFIACEKVQEM